MREPGPLPFGLAQQHEFLGERDALSCSEIMSLIPEDICQMGVASGEDGFS